MGEFGVAHVWFQCYEKDLSKNAQNTTLHTNSNPNPNPHPDPDPTHMNIVRRKLVFFFGTVGRPH